MTSKSSYAEQSVGHRCPCDLSTIVQDPPATLVGDPAAMLPSSKAPLRETLPSLSLGQSTLPAVLPPSAGGGGEPAFPRVATVLQSLSGHRGGAGQSGAALGLVPRCTLGLGLAPRHVGSGLCVGGEVGLQTGQLPTPRRQVGRKRQDSAQFVALGNKPATRGTIDTARTVTPTLGPQRK